MSECTRCGTVPAYERLKTGIKLCGGCHNDGLRAYLDEVTEDTDD